MGLCTGACHSGRARESQLPESLSSQCQAPASRLGNLLPDLGVAGVCKLGTPVSHPARLPELGYHSGLDGAVEPGEAVFLGLIMTFYPMHAICVCHFSDASVCQALAFTCIISFIFMIISGVGTIISICREELRLKEAIQVVGFESG